MTATAVADPTARESFRNADPVLARLIDARPDFRLRAWIDELSGLDSFRTVPATVVAAVPRTGRVDHQTGAGAGAGADQSMTERYANAI